MRSSRTVPALCLAIVLLAASASAALAQTQSLYWQRFDVDITIQQNGDLRVEETQVINFTSGVFHQGYAELSAVHTDGYTDVNVSEEGQAYREVGSTGSVTQQGEYAVDRLDNGNYEVVWDMGRTQDQTRTFVLAYTVKGAIRRYDAGNELQWNAISPGLHDFEIRAATVTLHLPPGAALSADAGQPLERQPDRHLGGAGGAGTVAGHPDRGPVPAQHDRWRGAELAGRFRPDQRLGAER